MELFENLCFGWLCMTRTAVVTLSLPTGQAGFPKVDSEEARKDYPR
jgi:hypothetical protein